VKVLVTGSGGFVGSSLLMWLKSSKQDYTVYGLDLKGAEQSVDLSNEAVCLSLMNQISVDVVIHLASSVSTSGSLANPTETFKNTVRTAVNVAEGCRLSNTPMILTSSVKARDGTTPYGAAKVMAETWVTDYMESYGLPVIVNRPGTIFGPGQEGSAESGWVAWFLKARDDGLKVTINGDGSQVRDLLWVLDYCELLEAQMLDLGTYAGHTWDVGGGRENAVSVKEMADHLKLDYEFGPPRTGDAQTYIGENICPTWKPTTSWKDWVMMQ